MDADRLSPQLGRLIDAAKADAAGRTAPRAQGVALLASDGAIYVGTDAAGALAAAQVSGAEELLAAAFAAGEPEETQLPGAECREVLSRIDTELPIVAKYLGRWVTVPLSELPSP